MKLQRKQASVPVSNTGSVLLLTTFIVLCLSVFAALSLSGALTEYRYSQKLAQHGIDYYRASGLAADMLKNIDGILENAYALDPKHYYETAEEQLSPIVHTDMKPEDGDPSVTCEIPISDTRSLKIVLALNPPERMEDGYYRITSWQEISSSEWNGNDSLNLMTF